MKQRIIFGGIAILFIAVACLVVRGFIRSRAGMDVAVKSMKTWQQADAALGFPLNAGAHDPDTGEFDPPILSEFDPRLIQLSAFERVILPTASHMSAPMGSEHGALTYNAQPFWADNTQRGGHHTGDDFNGIGGMNTDLGDPVYAVANGLVVYRGEPSSGWGKTLILAHRTPEGAILLSMYAHLDQISVAIGSLIPRSEKIGTVGTANLNYPAHLHLEMHDSTGIHIGAGYTHQAGDRINPADIIAKHQTRSSDHLSAPPFAIISSDKQAARYRGMQVQDQQSSGK